MATLRLLPFIVFAAVLLIGGGAVAALLLKGGIRAEVNTVAPRCGEFLPNLNNQWVPAPRPWVHFVPKICNKIMINGRLETIPPGTAVVNGGVVADIRNTCVDKVCGQALAPNMVYRAYVFMDGPEMKLTFSVRCEHREDPTYGNEVSECDPAQSFVGLLLTDENGLVCGGSIRLCTLSWFYRGHTALVHHIGPESGVEAKACETNGQLVPIDAVSITILTFGINSVFREGYNVPNFYLAGTLVNNAVGSHAHAALEIEWGGTPVTFDTGHPGVVNWSFHRLVPNLPLKFRTTGTLPKPLRADTVYYVSAALDNNRFTLSEAPGGPEIAITSAGSGDHIVIQPKGRQSPISSFSRGAANAAGAVATMVGGGGGVEEGYITARLLLGAINGGCTSMPSGILATSPHHS